MSGNGQGTLYSSYSKPGQREWAEGELEYLVYLDLWSGKHFGTRYPVRTPAVYTYPSHIQYCCYSTYLLTVQYFNDPARMSVSTDAATRDKALVL